MRPSINKVHLHPYQEELADLIDRALKRGQRPDSKTYDVRPWTDLEFSKAVGVKSPSTVRNWRNRNLRRPPYQIIPLLNAFFGEDQRFFEDRCKMLQTWRKARDLLDPLDDRDYTSNNENFDNLTGHLCIIQLDVSTQLSNADNSERLMMDLVITPDEDLTFRGRRITVGVKEVLLKIQSDCYEIAVQSRPSQRGNKNFERTAAGEAVIGPLNEDNNMIKGTPLSDSYFALINPNDLTSGIIDVKACVSRRSFKVLRNFSRDGKDQQKECSTTQEAVLNILLRDQLDERDDHDRAIISSKVLHVKKK